jgi:hypothetical protein
MKIIKGNLLNTKDSIIVQQCNCVTVKAHGLSFDIASKFPYADIYAKRSKSSPNFSTMESRGIPGTCIISKPMSTIGPIVASLMGQITPGKPGQWCKVYNVDPNLDDAKHRLEYFKSAMEELLTFRIGCGLASGNWPTYFKVIQNFDAKYKMMGGELTIYKM